MAIRVKLTGAKDLIKAFDKFGKDGLKEVDQVTALTADVLEADAKFAAPVDMGHLRNSIATQKIKESHYKVVANAHYSPYMEFGTGGFVNVPTVFKDQAGQWKGKKGKKINIHPQPFMYPAFLKAKVNYKKELKDALQYLTDKFNS